MQFKRAWALGLAAGGITLASSIAAPTRADVVTDWNQIWIDTIRAVGGPPCPIARAGAMMHVAMFDALEAIDCRYTPMIVKDVFPPRGANRQAAIASAAHDILVNLYPTRATIFDDALNTFVATLPDNQGRADGIAVGSQVAAKVIADHADDAPGMVDTNYVYGSGPGAYQPTFPDFTSPPFSPGYGHCKPWCMLNGEQFRSVRGPLGYRRMGNLLHSVKYANQVREVMLYGKRDSTVRTADQTEAAWFWANDRNGTYKPAGQLNSIAQTVSAQRHLNIEQNARLFAMINVAMADAGIIAWDQKYLTDVDLWRPITAIRNAATDGNPLTKANPNWIPLLDFTPPFPTYTSGHSTFAGAWAATMKGFFGTDDIAFSATSDEPNAAGVTRSFTSFSQAGLEDALSRVYLGVHFRMDCEDGYAHGYAMGTSMASTFFVRTCRADLTKDGAVTTSDLTLFTNSYFANQPAADYNKDGVINALDATQYMNDYFDGCPGQ